MNTAILKRINVISLCLILLISSLFCLNVSADVLDVIAVPEKPESFYVYDQAEVLGESAENNLVIRAKNLFNHTEAQVVIVTVNTLNGQNIETYANNILTEWKIGGEEGRGIILLLDIEEDIYVTISGNAFKSVFTSEVLQQLLNEKLEPHFLVNSYEDGVNSFFTEVYYMIEDLAESEALAESESEKSEETAVSKPANKKEESSSVPFFWSVLFTIILILALLFVAFIIVVYVHGQMVRKRRREAARRRRQAERRAERSRRDYY